MGNFLAHIITPLCARIHLSCCFIVFMQLMDDGDLLGVGLPVQKLVVVAYALDNASVIIPHPPMVVQTV